MTAPLREFSVDSLRVHVYERLEDMAVAAAHAAHACLREAVNRQGQAAAILASAASQVRFLEVLTSLSGLDWSRVALFHMDEYLGISDQHPASFRRFLREHVVQKVKPGTCHYLAGDALEPIRECDRYAGRLEAQPIDLCCLGIGENGHVAFNDPPVADFSDPRAVKIVKLDEACRRQQVGEGAFRHFDDVPQYALTLTIPTLCAAGRLICVVPERRKAQAVKHTLQGPIQTTCPASILCQQTHATLYLDAGSASLL